MPRYSVLPITFDEDNDDPVAMQVQEDFCERCSPVSHEHLCDCFDLDPEKYKGNGWREEHPPYEEMGYTCYLCEKELNDDEDY